MAGKFLLDDLERLLKERESKILKMGHKGYLNNMNLLEALLFTMINSN